MKTLKNYIAEGASSRKLTDSEREALMYILGVLSNEWQLDDGDDNQEEYEELRDTLSDSDRKAVASLFDVVQNLHDYKIINRSILHRDLPTLKRIMAWLDDHDLLDELELGSIYNEIVK